MSKLDENDPEIKKYAPLMGFMWWAINRPEGKKEQLGTLIQLGCNKLKLPYPPSHIEKGILLATLKLMTNGAPFTTITA